MRLVAASVSTGSVAWRKPGHWGVGVERADAVGTAAKYLYVGSDTVMNPATGATRFTLSGATRIDAVDATRVYANCGDVVCAFTKATGVRLWTSTVPASPDWWAPLTLAGALLYTAGRHRARRCHRRAGQAALGRRGELAERRQRLRRRRGQQPLPRRLRPAWHLTAHPWPPVGARRRLTVLALGVGAVVGDSALRACVRAPAMITGGLVHPAPARRRSTRTRRLAVMAALVVSVSALVSTNAAVAAPAAPGAPADGAIRPVPGPADRRRRDGAGRCAVRGRLRRGRRRRGRDLRPRPGLRRDGARGPHRPHRRGREPDQLLRTPQRRPARTRCSRPACRAAATRRSTAATAPPTATSEFTNDLEAAYPELVKVVKYGETYTEDNDLRVVCVTADADTGCKLQPDVDKARFLFVAQIHARELTTSEMTWRMLALLTDELRQGRRHHRAARRDRDLDRPADQPGRHRARSSSGFDGESGGDTWQRKNMHPEECAAARPRIGTDLNRNYEQQLGRRRLERLPVRPDLPRCVARRPSRRPTTCRT